jgi:RecJ-like exonuclease
MKKIIKYAFISLVAVALVLVALGSSVRAENNDVENQTSTIEASSSVESLSTEASTTATAVANENENNNVEEEINHPGSLSLSITPNGKVDIRGAKVTSISGNNLTISIFGLSLNATFSSSTNLISAPDSNLSQIKIGDVLQIKGTIDSSSGIISVNQVRDESLVSANISSIRARIQALIQELLKLQAQYGLPQGLPNKLEKIGR